LYKFQCRVDGAHIAVDFLNLLLFTENDIGPAHALYSATSFVVGSLESHVPLLVPCTPITQPCAPAMACAMPSMSTLGNPPMTQNELLERGGACHLFGAEEQPVISNMDISKVDDALLLAIGVPLSAQIGAQGAVSVGHEI